MGAFLPFLWSWSTSNATVSITGVAATASAGALVAALDVAPHDMTSNTSHPPYVASASTFYGPLYDAYAAFNGGVGALQYWIGTGGGTDWLQLDAGVGNSYTITGYAIQANTIPEPLRCPKNFTLQGSNNGSTWTVLDTRTNQISWGSGEQRNFAVTGAAAYRYFQLNITANNGDATYTDVGELYLYTAASGSSVTVSITGVAATCSAGTVAVVVSDTVPVVGVPCTGYAGTGIAIHGAANTSPPGVSATGSVGAVTVSTAGMSGPVRNRAISAGIGRSQ